MQQLVDLRISPKAPADSRYRALFKDLRAQLAGEVRFDDGNRALYATDGSNYRQVPIGVVLPQNTEDILRAITVCREHGAPILSRGCGTSLAGQCCNAAVVIDCSKYLRARPQIDPERRSAWVEPGTILDTLRREAGRHGLTFGPDPATHNHCTLGGMLGNNSCGVHALQAEFYGPGSRTSDNVRTLDIVTYDGERMTVGPTNDAEYERILRGGGRRAQIYRDMRALRDRYADQIRAGFPDIPRLVSGFNLPALLPENGFNIAQALVGSEGTCVVVIGAEMALIERFPARTLLVLGYPSVYEAGDHVPELRELKPIGLEGLDDLLIAFTKQKHLNPHGIQKLPEGEGFLLVEFGGQSQEEADAHAEEAMRRLSRLAQPPSMLCVRDPQDQEQIWAVRESGLGATAYVPGHPDSWPGWEDSAVPPDRVGTYLRQLRELLGRYGYEASLYGHFGQGCIHCRISFDLKSQEGVDHFRRFTREAAELVVRHGGSLSGEHGDGQARGDLLPIMFGPELVQAFRDFKAVWDPENKMNPGKVVDARARTDDLRLGPEYRPWRPATHFHYTDDHGDFAHAAQRCVGVGKCRREDGGTMCPSYMVTQEEMHSTRGRARLLFEMLQGDPLHKGWSEPSVKEALDLCLACKGCKSDCPVSVDMATYKAEFLAHYYEQSHRPRHAYAFGWIDKWAQLGSLAPDLANFVTHTPGLAQMAKFAAGMSQRREVPRFSPRPFRQWFNSQPRRANGGPRVVLWPDTFNNYFKPETLAAAADVLMQAGVHVTLPRKHLCCGRPLYDYGMLDQAKRYWQRILASLSSEIEAGIPVVGLEPSCVAAFRDELVNLYPHDARARALSEQTFTLSEYLVRENKDLPALTADALFHGHCHHKAVMGIGSEVAMLERMGVALECPDTGCCGMAGAFGYEADKYDVSIAAGERVLLPKVRESRPDRLLISDGFSCREQIEQTTGRRALHSAQVVQLAFHERARVQERTLPPERISAQLAPAALCTPRLSMAAMSGLFLAGLATGRWMHHRLANGGHAAGRRRERESASHAGIEQSHWRPSRRASLGDRGGLHPNQEPRAGTRNGQP